MGDAWDSGYSLECALFSWHQLHWKRGNNFISSQSIAGTSFLVSSFIFGSSTQQSDRDFQNGHWIISLYCLNFWNSYGPPAEIILTPLCIMTLLWPCSLISHHFSILSSIPIILKSFSLTRWAILSYVSATCQDLLPPFKPLPTSFSSFLPVTTYMAQALTCLGNSQPPQLSTLAEFLAQRALFVLVGWQN